ncbi:hypothetical protein TNCV_5013171 [Trichonephila clavipes]|nr:hypothetical protein TNCV_5013171 [Trichonephila clavipes]
MTRTSLHWTKIKQLCSIGDICCCCCLCHLIDSDITSKSTKFIAAKGYIFTPVVSLSFEHYAGDSTIWLGSIPIWRENTPRGGQGPPTFLPLPPTLQEDLQFHGYLEYSMLRRHCTFTNIHAFFGIRTQAPRHRSQRH